jgi:protein involved in polysaccharide export with SLBB domain
MGSVAYPLIGEVEAGGKTVRELEKLIAVKLRNGNLRKPRVGIEVTNYRPFYILGEVDRPGSYSYVEGMKIVNAVAMSGGFTYRAKKLKFLVRRAGAPKDSETEASPDDLLYPGDVVRIPERFL